MLMQPQQLILFGSPGTGKSHKVKVEVLPSLGIPVEDTKNSIRTVFHPEYTYGDFMGKLLPLTDDKEIKYIYYVGVFLRAIAKAYKNILEAEQGAQPANVALVIDEINRGNSAAIFGIGFQLLDRDQDGWSAYEVDISDMEFDSMLKLIGILKTGSDKDRYGNEIPIYKYKDEPYRGDKFNDFLLANLRINKRQLRLPPNLSIIATMNTSDSSIYHMDSAFKRRWSWKYIDINPKEITDDNDIIFANRSGWQTFINKLNFFIKTQAQFVRKAEDKQIGYYFLQEEQINKSLIRNKVMFFIWDSVFTSSKKPLINLLGLEEKSLVTFGDFTNQVDLFISKILSLEI